jgi:valyl-tRNA synthetase
VLASETVDADQVRRRIEERRSELEAEIERAESKLANDGFIAKAPPEVVEEERTKLSTYRSELEELD